MKKISLIFGVVVTVFFIIVIAAGCTKNPVGPSTGCALCAQETQTAEAGKATATPTNNVVVNATPTVTKTPTAVGNSTATITPTSTETSTATATVTITPQSTVIWEIVITGTPGDTFTISYGVYDEATELTAWTTQNLQATFDSDGNWNSLDVQTVPYVSDLFYQGVCDKILHVTVYRNGSIYGTSAPDPLQNGGNFSGSLG